MSVRVHVCIMYGWNYVDLFYCNLCVFPWPRKITSSSVEDYISHEQQRLNLLANIQSEDMKEERKFYGNMSLCNRVTVTVTDCWPLPNSVKMHECGEIKYKLVQIILCVIWPQKREVQFLGPKWPIDRISTRCGIGYSIDMFGLHSMCFHP
jgi:hypothetical protein